MCSDKHGSLPTSSDSSGSITYYNKSCNRHRKMLETSLLTNQENIDYTLLDNNIQANTKVMVILPTTLTSM